MARFHERIVRIDEEWTQRAELFESFKTAFEQEIAHKLEVMQRGREKDLQRLTCEVQNDLHQTLKEVCEGQAAREEQVIRQAEVFKAEYKRVLEKDLYERVQMMDERIAEREKKWVRILQAERERMVALERESHATQENIHLQAVRDAMQDVAKLREEVLKEQETYRVNLLKEFVSSRTDLTTQHEEGIRKASARVLEIQQRCATAIAHVEKDLEAVQRELADHKAELTDRQLREDEFVLQKMTEKCDALQHALESKWTAVLEAQRVRHEADLERIRAEHQTATLNLHATHQTHLSDLRGQCESRILAAEEAAEKHWGQQIMEGAEERKRSDAVLQDLRESNARLSDRVAALTQQLEQQAALAASQRHALQHELEEAWQQRQQETRQHYESLLLEAAKAQQVAVPLHEHTALRDQLREKDRRLFEMQAEQAKAVRDAQQEADRMWQDRLDQTQVQLRQKDAELAEELAAARANAQRDAQNLEKSGRDHLIAEQQKWEAHLQKLLEWETQRCQAAVEEAQHAAKHRLDKTLAGMEDAWKRRYAEFEGQTMAAEQALVAREDALRIQETQIHSEVLAKVTAALRDKRQQLDEEAAQQRETHFHAQIELDKKEAALREELEATYSIRLQVAKEYMQHHSSEWMMRLLDFMEAREAHWLEMREEESDAMKGLFQEELQRMKYHHQESVLRAQDSAKAVLQREAAALSERELSMEEHWVQLCAVAEESAAERSKQIVAAQTELRRQANHEDQERVHKQWETLQASILNEMTDAETDRREFEDDLRKHYAKLLNDAQQKAATAMSEAERVHAERVEALQAEWLAEEGARRSKVMELHETARAEWAQRLQETVTVYEERLHAVREQLAAATHREESTLAQARTAWQQQADAKRKDLEETTHLQLQEVRASCEERIEVLIAKEAALRAQAAKELADAEVWHTRERDRMVHDLQKHFEAVLCQIRSECSAKDNAHVVQAAAVEDKVGTVLAELRQRYATFVDAHSQRLLDVKAKQLEHTMRQHEEHEASLEALQERVEAAVRERLEALEKKSEAAEESRRLQFLERVAGLNCLLQHERERNNNLQTRLEELQAHQATSEATLDHQRLLTHRDLRVRFEGLLGAAAATPVQSSMHTSPPATATLPSPSFPVTPFSSSSPYVVNASKPSPNAAQWLYAPFVASSAGTPSRLQSPLKPPPPTGSIHVVSATPTIRTCGLPMGAAPNLPCSASARTPFPSLETASLSDLWHRVREMWSVVGLPPADQLKVESGVNALQSASAQVRRLQELAQPLEASLPILESYTRRAHLVQYLHSGAGDSSQNDAIREEVSVLGETLRRAVDEYERTYGRTLMFQGRRLMNLLDADEGEAVAACR